VKTTNLPLVVGTEQRRGGVLSSASAVLRLATWEARTGPAAHVEHGVVDAAAAQATRDGGRWVGRHVPLVLFAPAVVAQNLHPAERNVEDGPLAQHRLGAAAERVLRRTARLEHQYRVARLPQPASHHAACRAATDNDVVVCQRDAHRKEQVSHDRDREQARRRQQDRTAQQLVHC